MHAQRHGEETNSISIVWFYVFSLKHLLPFEVLGLIIPLLYHYRISICWWIYILTYTILSKDKTIADTNLIKFCELNYCYERSWMACKLCSMQPTSLNAMVQTLKVTPLWNLTFNHRAKNKVKKGLNPTSL